ncbi:MAG: STAS domain-containing protein [Planctomycetes bacterium]|nr:STAS domain-containing protein [Planctomycetota bacterium]
MADSFEIAGFRVLVEGDEAICRFAGVEVPTPEVLPNPQEAFAKELQPGGRLAGKRLVVALDDVPAISSSQLGSLLAIHKATGREDKTVVRSAGPNIRELFDITRMDRYFDY